MSEDKKIFELFKKTEEKEKHKILVFQFNDQLGDFEELEIEEGVPLHELFDSNFILLFIDHEHYRAWLWHGSNTTTRMKFIAAKIASKVRDKHGLGYKITAVDEGEEMTGFKITTGLKVEVEQKKEDIGPAYAGTEQDLALLEELSLEKIVLLLERVNIPEGYERKMVIVKNQIYGYKEFEKNYMGSVIKEKKLFPLKEEVPDGTFLAENLVPRMLFSYNNVVLTELLQKVSNKNV